jgi:hypothetical protein
MFDAGGEEVRGCGRFLFSIQLDSRREITMYAGLEPRENLDNSVFVRGKIK